MGITKSLMNTGGRAIFNRMSGMLKDSPRLQSLVATGADIIAPDGPDKSATSNALVNLFKEKGLTLLRDQLSNGSKSGFLQSLLNSDNSKTGLLMKAAFVVAPALAIAVTVLSKLTSALQETNANLDRKPHGTALDTLIAPTAEPAAASPAQPARAGTDLMGLLQIGSVPNTPSLSNVDASFDDWARSEKASRAEFGHTERQLRETQNIVYMLQTDLRNDPGDAEIERRLADAKQNAERAQELHAESMDKRHAIVEQGKMFGHQADTLLANEPVPVDWNRPKDFIPDNWDQPAGPAR